MGYTVKIDGVAELTEEVIDVEFISKIPVTSNARSADLDVTICIEGKISFDADKVLMKDSTGEIAKWSLIKPDDGDSYKNVKIEYKHANVTRNYEFTHAFVISYTERFGTVDSTDGTFQLLLKQKKDRVDGVTV